MREDTHANMAPVHSIRQPRFARILQTVKLPPSMDEVYPQKVMVETHKGSHGDLQCEKFPTPTVVQLLKDKFQN